MPYGDDYSMGGEEPAERVPILTLVSEPPWDQMPVLKHGAGGLRTDLVCGYLHSGDPLFDPALRALPSVFVVRLPDGPAAQWVETSIRYALATTAESLPAGPMSTRLPELVLIEVLRIHLASAPAADAGWIAALHDSVLAPALANLHASPERKWTVAGLASTVAVSRSVLDERFRSVLGRSPIRYLTEWRMHLADDLLASTDLGLASVARRVGYDSEEAFSPRGSNAAVACRRVSGAMHGRHPAGRDRRVRPDVRRSLRPACWGSPDSAGTRRSSARFHWRRSRTP